MGWRIEIGSAPVTWWISGWRFVEASLLVIWIEGMAHPAVEIGTLR